MTYAPESKVGTVGWIGLTAGVILWDSLARETLSGAYDRYLEKNKALAVGVIAVTAAHLCNVLPLPLDPIYQIEKRAKTFTKKYL